MTRCVAALAWLALAAPALACPSCAGQPQTRDTFVLVLGLMAVPVIVAIVLIALIGPAVRAASRKVTVGAPATSLPGPERAAHPPR